MGVRWLLAIAILGVSFVAAYWGGTAAREWRKPPPVEVVEGLAIPAADLDMGEVWEAKGIAWRLPIHNQTAATVEIHDLLASCGCTSIEPRKLSISAGETATINLQLDLTHRTYSDAGLAERPFAVMLRPVIGAGQPRGPAWKLHGTIKSRVTVDPLAVDFGERPVHGQTPVTQKIVAAVHLPCRDLEVMVEPKVATATIHRRSDDETTFDIVLAANPNLPPGEFKGEAQIKVVTPTGERWPGFTMLIGGKMQPEVRLLPSRLLLEAKPIGEMAEAVVTLQASPDAKVAVDHIEIDSPDLRVEPVTVEGIPAGRAFRVRQTVRKDGEQVSEVRFVIRKPDKKLITLPVQVCCRGEAITAANQTGVKEP
jgi:hypothetical protein